MDAARSRRAPPSSAASATHQAPTAPEQASGYTRANDEWLAQAFKLYYSTKQVGLDGVDCDVHPDRITLFTSSNQGARIADDDPHIATLKELRTALHAHLRGSSTMEGNRPLSPDKPLDAETTTMLEQLHQATEQNLQGFLQFWTPFVDRSAVPASGDGLKTTRSANDMTLHGEQNGSEVTEIFSNEMILEHFDVVTNGMSTSSRRRTSPLTRACWSPGSTPISSRGGNRVRRPRR